MSSLFFSRCFLLFWIFIVRSSSFSLWVLLHFYCEFFYIFIVRLSSFFELGCLHFLGEFIFIFWERSSSFFWWGHLHCGLLMLLGLVLWGNWEAVKRMGQKKRLSDSYLVTVDVTQFLCKHIKHCEGVACKTRMWMTWRTC